MMNCFFVVNNFQSEMLITILLHDRLQIATRQTTFKLENYELVIVYYHRCSCRMAGW
jgi:hypothetical protein